MSNEDGGKVEDQGIPGYSANNTIPGGFSLPLPTATNSIDPEPEADGTADPWSSTWDDTSWQLPDADSSDSLYSSEELSQYSGGGTASGSDWGDSFDHGGEPGSEPSGVETATGWETWEPSVPWPSDRPCSRRAEPSLHSVIPKSGRPVSGKITLKHSLMMRRP